MTEQEARELGEAHWKYLEEREHKAFIDAWMHSWKHTQEEKDAQN